MQGGQLNTIFHFSNDLISYKHTGIKGLSSVYYPMTNRINLFHLFNATMPITRHNTKNIIYARFMVKDFALKEHLFSILLLMFQKRPFEANFLNPTFSHNVPTIR